jgi:hypothetical protein
LGGKIIGKAFTLGRNVGGRAAQMQLDRGTTQMGGFYDTLTAAFEDLKPAEVYCR